MTYLEQLRAEQETLSHILQTEQTNSPEALRPGAHIVHNIYVQILKDAISILSSLISYLTPGT